MGNVIEFRPRISYKEGIDIEMVLAPASTTITEHNEGLVFVADCFRETAEGLVGPVAGFFDDFAPNGLRTVEYRITSMPIRADRENYYLDPVAPDFEVDFKLVVRRKQTDAALST